MKTILFICFFISAIISIKASNSDVAVADTVSFIPSARLIQIEKNMSTDEREFIECDNVKETLTNTFLGSMVTPVAKCGLNTLHAEWWQMVNGPEASRLIDAFGQNLATLFRSANGSNMINTMLQTLHYFLEKIGSETRVSGMGEVVSGTLDLLASPRLPEIVNKTGGLVITAANKPMMLNFVRNFWKEFNVFLNNKELGAKVKKSFNNLTNMMQNISNTKKNTPTPVLGRTNSARRTNTFSKK